jgi:hypothetical protein
MRVRQTIVVRPTCTGEPSARAISPTLSEPAIEPFPPAGEPGPDQKIVAAFRQIDRAYYVPRNRHDDPL